MGWLVLARSLQKNGNVIKHTVRKQEPYHTSSTYLTRRIHIIRSFSNREMERYRQRRGPDPWSAHKHQYKWCGGGLIESKCGNRTEAIKPGKRLMAKG